MLLIKRRVWVLESDRLEALKHYDLKTIHFFALMRRQSQSMLAFVPRQPFGCLEELFELAEEH